MARLRTRHEASCLAVLHRMGLAESIGGASWLVRRDCGAGALSNATQREPAEDLGGTRPIVVRRPTSNDNARCSRPHVDRGKILLHGGEDASRCSYLMLERTDGQVYPISRTLEMDELRCQRGLQRERRRAGNLGR
jgi:hypothetical protein